MVASPESRVAEAIWETEGEARCAPAGGRVTNEESHFAQTIGRLETDASILTYC
jgi:hypothetical protein